MKIEIKKRWTGEVIYSHECDNNTIKKTVEAANYEAYKAYLTFLTKQ